jgi:hypothetical protein
MAKPKLTSAQFPTALHKRLTSLLPSKVIVIATGIKIGNPVNVNGTRGMIPTRWCGTITKNITDNAWLSDDLEVVQEEESIPRKTAGSGGGSEDVSVTVTNTTGTSDPVITPSVPTVP